MTDERLAEVVSIHPDRDLEDDDAPVATKPESTPTCRHRRVAVDEASHKVICRDCDREVDPVAFLQYLAREWERYARHRKEAERRARAAHERLQETLRLERNARARLKKLDPKSKPPAAPWGGRSVGW